FSLAALEVLASGVPMIMSNIGGASEIVEDGVNGYLFEAGNTEQLVERLKAISDPARQAALAARARHSVEEMSEARMADRYAAFLDDLSRS
ncbi:MAG TPA: glycosyltransferase, partial [Microvirga sp.]